MCWQWACLGVCCVCRQFSPSLLDVLQEKCTYLETLYPGLCMTSVTGQLSYLLIRTNPQARVWCTGGGQYTTLHLLPGEHASLKILLVSLLLPSKGAQLQQFVTKGRETMINYELRKEKEERTQCLQQVWKRALLSFTSCSLASVISSQQAGKHTSEYSDAGKEMWFTQIEIGEKKFIRSSWMENLPLLQVLDRPAILHVKYNFYLTGTLSTTFDCHV